MLYGQDCHSTRGTERLVVSVDIERIACLYVFQIDWIGRTVHFHERACTRALIATTHEPDSLTLASIAHGDLCVAKPRQRVDGWIIDMQGTKSIDRYID